jgi:hypothetical protein
MTIFIRLLEFLHGDSIAKCFYSGILKTFGEMGSFKFGQNNSTEKITTIPRFILVINY